MTFDTKADSIPVGSDEDDSTSTDDRWTIMPESMKTSWNMNS